MSVDLFRIQSGPIDIFSPQKNRDQAMVPVLSWLVARKKMSRLRGEAEPRAEILCRADCEAS
jgi:hypothetical protein